ncbi:MAG TPA: hypothetical protein VFE30_19310 [Anaeromyxobacteraceae bacterium]|jgi:hypothetical protein|nr:hypothetical protein [Anaeromyxobacteraceae bacterium]
MSRKIPDPSTHARPTKGKTAPKRSDRWADSHEGLKFIRRTKKGQRVRSEEFIQAVGTAVEQGFAVAGAAAVMFKILDAVALLNEVADLTMDRPLHPQQDEVLASLDELGAKSFSLVEKAAALRREAKALAVDVNEMNAFLKANRVLLNNRRQLASEQQVISVYVNRIEKKLGIEKARVEPKELETLVQLSAIHQGHDLADAPASLQEMAERWRTMSKKVRRALVSNLEKALARKKLPKPSP